MKTTKEIPFLKRLLKLIGWVAVIWILLLAAIRIVLTPSVLDKLIDRYASEYVDGTISLEKAELSVFRHFPNVGLTLHDFTITYPSDRFDDVETEGAQGHLAKAGTGTTADTLVSFRKFTGRINLTSLVSGKLNIPYAELEKPRIFAHRYHDGQANWDIIRMPADTASEESGGMPEMKFGRIRLSGHPHVVYSDSRDTIFAMADMKSMSLRGRIDAEKISRSRIGMKIDSFFVAGRIAADTVAFGLEHLGVMEKQGKMQLDARAKALLATRSLGRMHIPAEISFGLEFPDDMVPAISVSALKAEIASVPLAGNADIRLMEDRLGIKADLAVRDCKAENVIDRFLKDYIPVTADIRTDASFTLEAECSGEYIYADGTLPQFTARITIPESSLNHRAIENEMNLSLDASAGTTADGRLQASLGNLDISCNGLSVKASADIPDIMQDDFLINIDGDISADLNSLMTFVPDTLDLEASGKIQARLKGGFRPSHLDIYRFSQSELEGRIDTDSLIIVSGKDSLDITIRKMDVEIGPQYKTSRIDTSKTFRLLALTGNIGSTDIRYGTMGLSADRLKLSAMNSADGDTTTVSRLGGRLSAAKVTMTDAGGMEVELKGTENGFQMLPKKDRPEVPVLTVNSDNDRIMVKDGINRLIFTDAKVGAMAAMNTFEQRQRSKAFLDSLARLHPDVPRDSLMAHFRASRQPREIPEWMREEDFRKSDIDIHLDETLSKYFREWGMQGRIDVRTGILMTPYFPTRNILRGMEVTFDNNRIGIDSLKIRAGESEIAAKGELTGLRRALLGRGILNLDLGISSDRVNANELLTAYANGSRYVPPKDKSAIEEATDAEFFKMVTTDTLAVKDSVTPLIVIPSNLNAQIRVNGSGISYSDLSISNLQSKLTMKERCVQITETSALTNMGDIGLEGFYATRTKKDIKAGFSINFKDITAEKVIDMMPAVDTLMPLLKSFKGNLDCELAATTAIDTNMNVILPSINGIIRIGGRDMSITDSDVFMELARKLKFKNKEEGYIDSMSVEGVISDSMLEVFPFIVKLDRYTLAMSGVHNMDESFRYHVSVLRSPLLIRLGIDLYGEDFDNMKFRLGKAKYKSTQVPVFSSVIDTTKINLVNSIRGIFEKGIEAAISENEKKEAIEKHKQEIGYVRAVDQELEALSEREKKQMEVELQEDKPKENIF